MERYILRFRGPGAAPTEDVSRIGRQSNVRIVDSSPKMLLVEADSAAIKKLQSTFDQWRVSEENTVPLPDTRARIKRP